MQIESIIRRKNGTTVVFDKTEYHFNSPVAEGPHVATVENDDHAQRFLAIKEGFKIYRATPSPIKAPEPVKAKEPEPIEGDVNGDGVVDSKDERATLTAAYEAKFGKKPHYKMGLDKLRESLE